LRKPRRSRFRRFFVRMEGKARSGGHPKPSGSCMSAAERLFTNAAIVLPDRLIHGSVLIREGRIAAVDGEMSRSPAAIDCEGDYLIPGLVELHTDNVERHLIPRPGTLWPASAAMLSHDREMVVSGITTVLNALCVGEVHSRSIDLGHLDEIRIAMDDHI